MVASSAGDIRVSIDGRRTTFAGDRRKRARRWAAATRGKTPLYLVDAILSEVGLMSGF